MNNNICETAEEAMDAIAKSLSVFWDGTKFDPEASRTARQLISAAQRKFDVKIDFQWHEVYLNGKYHLGLFYVESIKENTNP